MKKFDKIYKNILKESIEQDQAFFRQLAFHNFDNNVQFNFLESIIAPRKEMVQNIIDNYKYTLGCSDDYITYLQIPRALLKNQEFVNTLTKQELCKLLALDNFNDNDHFNVEEYKEVDYNQDQIQRVRQWKRKVGIKF